jgi:hypothetical protein
MRGIKMNYETKEMSAIEASKFRKWFWENIGTEIDSDSIDNDKQVILCLDLTMHEVKMIRNYENEINQ